MSNSSQHDANRFQNALKGAMRRVRGPQESTSDKAAGGFVGNAGDKGGATEAKHVCNWLMMNAPLERLPRAKRSFVWPAYDTTEDQDGFVFTAVDGSKWGVSVERLSAVETREVEG